MAVMCLATQSASDVLESPISRTIVEQTPTKVFFPNPDASADDYIEGFGLTEREFKLDQGAARARARDSSWSSRAITASCASSTSRASTRSSR